MPDYRYSCASNSCGKVYIGPRPSIVPMCCCATPKKMKGVPFTMPVSPLSEALTEQLSTDEAANLRGTLCKRWGITNKSHKSHGSNFSSNQTVANLINDIVAPVQGLLRAEVRQAVLEMYSYDIDTQMMG